MGYYIIHARWFYNKFSFNLLDLRLKRTVLGVLSLSARNFWRKKFRELAFDRENRKKFLPRENFPLYSMCASNLCPLLILITQSLLCLSPSFASLPPLPLSLLCLSPSLSYSPFSLLFLSLSLLFLSFPVALFLSPPRIRQAAASLNFPPPSSAGSTV